MKIYDFVDDGLGHSSYVIDLGDGTAAIVDPPRFPTAQEALVVSLGLQLVGTFIAPAASHLESPHRPVSDCERITLADGLDLIVMSTPGHTADHHAYLLVEHGAPVALFTGGSLMVGTIGRTDLCGPVLAVPLAHDMFASLRRFDRLPGDLAVYPTHGAGSFCSAPGASQRTSTLGHERATNPLFSITDEDLAGPATVMCGHGERAMTGASILTANGHEGVVVLGGGPDTWSAATGHPLETTR